MDHNRTSTRMSLSNPREWRRALGLGPHVTLALIWGLGFMELLVILVICVLLFGAKRIPEIARGIGAGIRNFKGEMKDDGTGERRLPEADHEEPRD